MNKNWNNYESSSSSSTDNSRYSRKKHSSKSGSRYHKKSKRRHRSNSSSDYSSSRHKRSSRSYRRDESHSKKKHRKSSSSSYESNNSNSSFKNHHHQSKSSKTFDDNENNKRVQDDLLVGKSEIVNKTDHDENWLQKNVLDIVKRKNSIEQINQEGFVFKVFNPSSEQKDEEATDKPKLDVPKVNEEVIGTSPTEESTFIICNPERLLNAKYKLLTKQERSLNWAKQLFESYNKSEHNGGQFKN
ncbi:serine/Arginine-related protein 53-like isoform X2 [Melanaphis sacchari]|uniref:serine/Arginine-related protein 53-like isoform X2 n=1 Tax=Melanaphis sacchari TaxID=742174 RepID=UPI000DC14F13|nr:serine/Arginine-related protein 53-like isoform X2 [Melanaphis sacchari]